MDVHVFPILNTLSTSLPIPSLWVISVHQPRASCIMHRTWTSDSFHIWYYTCFNAILSNHPTLSLSHKVQKTLESPLDCKEIQSVYSKGDQSWVFIGRTYAEAETPILWPPHAIEEVHVGNGVLGSASQWTPQIFPGSMHNTGCLGLVHWDDPEGWYGEGGGFKMENTCITVADSFWYMAKPI